MPDRTQIVARLIQQLLDRGYVDAAGAVINAITRNSTTGILAQRLSELDTEAARLAKLGLRLKPDNPVVRALMADFEDVMRVNGALVNSAAGDVTLSGLNAAGPLTQQLSLPGFTPAQIAGVGWNIPNPDAVAALVQRISGDAFAGKLAAYSAGTVEVAQGVITRSFVDGWGPARAARALRQAVEGLPTSYANQLMRTMQLTAMRDGQVVHRVANAGILEYQIRIAALDGRTCMSCVALHGTRLPIDARIDDHHRGRCTSITKVRGLQAPTVQVGPDWFTTLPESRQRELMGNSKWEALKAGAIKWPDFSRKYTDDLFGDMIAESSLKGMLGKGAEEFYGKAG